MGSCQISKYQINLDLIEIIQFCLMIYDCGDILPIDGCMGGWVDEWVNQ